MITDDKYLSLLPTLKYINNLIKNGIIIGDKKMSFTMLDYYTLTKENTYDILCMMRRKYYKDLQTSSYLHNFILREGCVVRIIDNPEEVLEQKNSFIVNGKRYTPSLDDIVMLFNLFDENDIPRYSKLIYIALNRIARDEVILPLLSNEEKCKTR